SVPGFESRFRRCIVACGRRATMIWCRFDAGEGPRYGVVEGEQVEEVDGSPFAGYREVGRNHALSAVKLLVPVIPSTFYCAGVTYRDHVIRMAAMRGEEPVFPKQADIGYRTNNALIAHGEPIVIPRDASDEVQYEGELVAVFGKKARNVSLE